MPYISNEAVRQHIDGHVDDLKIWYPGELAYAIARLCDNFIQMAAATNGGSKSYETLALIDGILGTAQAEFRRRILFPYEDEKLAENGDVYTS